MPSPLATLFSSIDSVKRVLADRLSPAGMRETLVRSADSLNTLTADAETAKSKSVLISPEQKNAANVRVTDAVLGPLVGVGGMIFPAAAVSKKAADEAAKLISEGKHQEAYAAYRTYFDQADGMLKTVVPDTNRARNFGPLSNLPKAGSPVTDSVDLGLRGDMTPRDFVQFMDSTTLHPQAGRGAYYSFASDRIGLGQDVTRDQLESNLLHEMQHGSQALYDMGRGGSPDYFFSDPGKFEAARAVVDQRIEDMVKKHGAAAVVGKKASGPAELQYAERDKLLADPGSLTSLSNFLQAPRAKAYEHYAGLPGEVESRLVQKQFETGDYHTLPQLLRDTPAAEMTTNPRAVPKVDADPVTQAILAKILGYAP